MDTTTKVPFARLERVDILDPAGNTLPSLTPDDLPRPAPARGPGHWPRRVPTAAPAPPRGVAQVQGEWVFRPAGAPGSAAGCSLTFGPLPGGADAVRYPLFYVAGRNGVTGQGNFRDGSGNLIALINPPSPQAGQNRATLSDARGVLRLSVQWQSTPGGRNVSPAGEYEDTRRGSNEAAR
jgi:hypothetical protein